MMWRKTYDGPMDYTADYIRIMEGYLKDKFIWQREKTYDTPREWQKIYSPNWDFYNYEYCTEKEIQSYVKAYRIGYKEFSNNLEGILGEQEVWAQRGKPQRIRGSQ